MSTYHWIGTTSNNLKDAGNWSDTSNGPSNGLSPTSLIDLQVGGPGEGAATGQTLVVTTGFTGKSLTIQAPATSGNYTVSGTNTATIAGAVDVYANCIWTHTGAFTFTNTTPVVLAFRCPITSTLNLNGTNGTWTLGSDLMGPNNKFLTVAQNQSGSFDAAGFNVTFGNISFSASGTITMGAGTFTLTGSGTVWDCHVAPVFNAGTGVIVIAQTAANATSAFAGGGLTYTKLKLAQPVGHTSSVSITGSNTFVDWEFASLDSHSVLFTAATTTTFTNPPTVTSASGIVYTIDSVGLAATHNLTFSGVAVVNLRYANIVNRSVASRTAYAGTGSSGTGSTNWVYTAAPNTARAQSQGASYYSKTQYPGNGNPAGGRGKKTRRNVCQKRPVHWPQTQARSSNTQKAA